MGWQYLANPSSPQAYQHPFLHLTENYFLGNWNLTIFSFFNLSFNYISPLIPLHNITLILSKFNFDFLHLQALQIPSQNNQKFFMFSSSTDYHLHITISPSTTPSLPPFSNITSMPNISSKHLPQISIDADKKQPQRESTDLSHLNLNLKHYSSLHTLQILSQSKQKFFIFAPFIQYHLHTTIFQLLLSFILQYYFCILYFLSTSQISIHADVKWPQWQKTFLFHPNLKPLTQSSTYPDTCPTLFVETHQVPPAFSPQLQKFVIQSKTYNYNYIIPNINGAYIFCFFTILQTIILMVNTVSDSHIYTPW